MWLDRVSLKSIRKHLNSRRFVAPPYSSYATIASHFICSTGKPVTGSDCDQHVFDLLYFHLHMICRSCVLVVRETVYAPKYRHLGVTASFNQNVTSFHLVPPPRTNLGLRVTKQSEWWSREVNQSRLEAGQESPNPKDHASQ